jgi:hypothetical protein
VIGGRWDITTSYTAVSRLHAHTQSLHHVLINTPRCRGRDARIGTHNHHIPRMERQQLAHKRGLPLWHAMDLPM